MNKRIRNKKAKQRRLAWEHMMQDIQADFARTISNPQWKQRRDAALLRWSDVPSTTTLSIVPPYTVMHDGKPVITNFGAIEQIKARLQAARDE
jgi:hypothetical protein